ncbi:uncharacterized protein LOC142318104 [Lycorma delicatula]|uniref:uncharacterized protein LOC142318104 n=1 Tax=Lycorma delicatula TaxID=130591 RepID=UPI003F51751F
MARRVCITYICLLIVLFYYCNAQQSGDGFNIYKDMQIGKTNDVLKDGLTKETVDKEELILPSVAAKVNIEDTSKRNTMFRNLMIGRQIPEREIFDDSTSLDDLFALMQIPESKVTVPRVVKNIALRPVDKKAGLFGHFDKRNYYYKRDPGSVLTWTIASPRPALKHETRSGAGKHSYLQPSSFIATMGKRLPMDY